MSLECAKGYVEESKGQVSKSIVVQTLQSCKLAPTNSFTDNGMQRV